MQTIRFRKGIEFSHKIHSICGYLGSFDPPHKGHEWIVRQLLNRFDGVVMLVPARHFHKQIRFPANARLSQRLDMLEPICQRHSGRIMVGITREVLFVRLAQRLAKHFPMALITFGMGNDTFDKFLDSRSYFQQCRMEWTPMDAMIFEQLVIQIQVFGRSSLRSGILPVPESIRWISSSRIRKMISLSRSGTPNSIHLYRDLASMVSKETLDYILRKGLYTRYSGF